MGAAGAPHPWRGQNGDVAYFDGIPGLGVWLEPQPDGAVRIVGQDLTPPTGLGGGEYEYAMTIAAADTPRLAEALGTDVDGIPAAWEAQASSIVFGGGERRWLIAHDIPFEFWSRVGE